MTQHINQSPRCLADQEAAVSNRLAASQRAQQDANTESAIQQGLQHSKQSISQATKHPDSDERASGRIPLDQPDPQAEESFPDANDNDSECDEAINPPLRKRIKRPDRIRQSIETAHDSDSTEGPELDANVAHQQPNTTMIREFREYCSSFHTTFLSLTASEKAGIKLMDVLRRKAPLHAYKDVMEWHLKECGKLQQHEKMGDQQEYQSRKTLMQYLLTRYNLHNMRPKMRTIRLPSSKAVVQVPYREAADCIVSLLTDPRFDDQDFLFFHDDPRLPPPENITHLADLNTGEAYLKTYEKRITKPNQVLLPVVFYIDGAVTGQFTDLPVTALKMSLGLHNQQARDRPEAWRELGYVPVVRQDRGRGKKIFMESGHLESQEVTILDGEGDEQSETDEDDEEEPSVKAQDFHTILQAILESFVKLQETGFIWDLVHKGKCYKNIEFVLFVPFVKCDTEEADLLCGKYTCRTRNVKHICRYCHCPTTEADDPRANFPLKKQAAIQKLVDNNDLAKLKEISQQSIQNAWYDVTFHQANSCGIHHACPSEKLHAIQLGIFKYIRGIFFRHMGESSRLAEDVNGLATIYGKQLTRQSDRDLPNTNFAKGIQKGKLMARDFRGVLLIMAAVLRSTQGCSLLFRRKKFGKEAGLRDWTLLVELMLEWEAFLGLKKMRKSHVKRLAKKHRFIMYIMKTVATRSCGMGLKVMKFHAIIHLIEDMLLYGVPTEFDTGSNESHHKDSKYAAKLTQRKEETFNEQTAIRLLEFLCIDLAMSEVVNDRCVWEYFEASELVDTLPIVPESDDEASNLESADPTDPNGAGQSDPEATSEQIYTGGTMIKIFEDKEHDNEPSFQMLTCSKSMRNGTSWSMEIICFLNDLQNLVASYNPYPILPVHTEHKRGNHVFYGHPNYRSSGPWKDWAIFDWGDYGELPCHIWCFVTLENLPKGRDRLEFGGIYLEDGVCAVVETTTYNEDEAEVGMSDLFTPLLLDVEGVDGEGFVTGRQFYLANTEAIASPCCVIPDIGGKSNAYFQVEPRRKWSDLFITWLDSSHKEDIAQYSDDED